MHEAREFRMMAQLARMYARSARDEVNLQMARSKKMMEWPESDHLYVGLLIFDEEYHEMRSKKLDEIAGALEDGE